MRAFGTMALMLASEAIDGDLSLGGKRAGCSKQLLRRFGGGGDLTSCSLGSNVYP